MLVAAGGLALALGAGFMWLAQRKTTTDSARKFCPCPVMKKPKVANKSSSVFISILILRTVPYGIVLPIYRLVNYQIDDVTTVVIFFRNMKTKK